jgi:HSP20 family protein
MSNTLSPFRGTLTSPFGSFLSDRLFDSFFDDALAYPFTNTSRRSRGIDANYNVSKTDKGFQISVAAPGVKKDDINVNIDSDTLTISYTQEDNTNTSFACSSFSRSWRLPEGTDADNIAANYDNGILTLSVPTADVKTYARTIEVK